MDKKLIVALLYNLKSFCVHYTNDELITKEKLNQYMQKHIDDILTILE